MNPQPKGSIRNHIDSVTEGILLRDWRLAFIAGKGLLHHRLVRLPGKSADDGDNHQPRQHGEGTTVDGRLEQGREGRAAHHVQNHDSCPKDEAGPAGCLGGLFPIEAVEEGGQERACQSTPRHAHKLGNKAHRLLILHDGDDHGDHHEHHDETAHDKDGLSVVHILHQVVLQKVNGQGGGGGDDQGGQGGHGGGEHQNHHNGDEDIWQRGEHGGDYGVIAVLGNVDLIGEQPSKAT